LLNPPGSQRYTRDCLHSNVTKGIYYWHQLDLLLQSGWLNEVAEIEVLDAIAENLSVEETRRRACAVRWDYVLFLTGEKSMEEDRRFIEQLAQDLPEARFFASGDVVFFRGEKPFAEYANLVGVVTDFAADGMKRFIQGERGSLPGLRYMNEEGQVVREETVKGGLTYPTPLHSAFPQANYELPFGSPGGFASVLTNYGCPYPCSYCNAKDVGFRKREVTQVLDELAGLKEQGYTKIYFRDPTFATHREHGLEICEAMVQRDLCFEWNAFTRPDIMDAAMLKAMAASGCTVLQFGLETPDLEMLTQHRKTFEKSQIRDVIQECHANGIKVCGHFMIGFPGEDPKTWGGIVDYALALDCDYFALNTAEVRLGTTLNSRPPALDLVRERIFFEEHVLSTAVRKLNRKFYLRPSFIFSQLAGIRNPSHLMRLTNLGMQMLKPRNPES